MRRDQLLISGQYDSIPRAIRRDTNLTPAEKMVMISLIDHLGANEITWPGASTIAEENGICRVTAARSLAKLAKDGYIRAVGKRISGQIEWEVTCNKMLQGVIQNVTGGVTKSIRGCNKTDVHLNHSIELLKRTTQRTTQEVAPLQAAPPGGIGIGETATPVTVATLGQSACPIEIVKPEGITSVHPTPIAHTPIPIPPASKDFDLDEWLEAEYGPSSEAQNTDTILPAQNDPSGAAISSEAKAQVSTNEVAADAKVIESSPHRSTEVSTSDRCEIIPSPAKVQDGSDDEAAGPEWMTESRRAALMAVSNVLRFGTAKPKAGAVLLPRDWVIGDADVIEIGADPTEEQVCAWAWMKLQAVRASRGMSVIQPKPEQVMPEHPKCLLGDMLPIYGIAGTIQLVNAAAERNVDIQIDAARTESPEFRPQLNAGFFKHRAVISRAQMILNVAA